MNERDKIRERLRKKEQEIQNLDEKLKAARIYIQALQDVLKMLDADSDASESAETTLRAGSLVAQARDVILDRSKPVHVNELMDALGRENTRESRASLTGSIAAYVRRQEIFTRPAPNTYGLVELGHAEVEPDQVEPPSGFGRTSAPPPAPSRSSDPDMDEEIPF